MDKDFSYKINSITKKVTVSGYVCIYHDLENKVIRFNKGVFGNSISNTDFVKLLCLDKTKQPIGKITKIYGDDVGLFVEASINSHTEEGKEAQRLLITNGIEKISINFKITTSSISRNFNNFICWHKGL
jgi:HK97 family phage prohead protease